MHRLLALPEPASGNGNGNGNGNGYWVSKAWLSNHRRYVCDGGCAASLSVSLSVWVERGECD